MSTVHKLIFWVVGGVAGAVLLTYGLDYRENKLEQALRDKVSGEIQALNKEKSVSHLPVSRQELVEEVRMTSTAYYQNRKTVRYQMATMSPCNPRIYSCI